MHLLISPSANYVMTIIHAILEKEVKNIIDVLMFNLIQMIVDVSVTGIGVL